MFSLLTFSLLTVGDLVWWRIANARVRRLRWGRFWQSALALWMGWLLLYLIYNCVAPGEVRRSDSPVPVPLHAAMFIWHLFILPMLLIFEFAESMGLGIWTLLRWIYRSVQARRKPTTPPAISYAPAHTLSRRQLIGGAAMALPPLITAGLVGRAMQQLHSPLRIRRMDLRLPQLPPHLDGMTITHLTDLHVGKFTGPRALRSLVEQVNGLRSDFIAVTGDLIDVALSDLPLATDYLNRLDPRHGMLVCEGNHDLFENRAEFESRTRAAGLPLLVDEARTINFRGYPIQFLGTRWDEGGDQAISQTFQTVQQLLTPETFPILLAHHPHAFDEAAGVGIPLTLSGHTHGGQLMITDNIGGGPLFFRYWSGLYRKNRSSLVVSNGVGAWFPLRINAPAEIVHLTLHPSA